jgi:hypothetical protein
MNEQQVNTIKNRTNIVKACLSKKHDLNTTVFGVNVMEVVYIVYFNRTKNSCKMPLLHSWKAERIMAN